MKKRFLSMISALTVATSVLCINAGAAGMVYKQDFENPPESGIVADMEGWKAYDSARTQGASFEDGALKLERYEAGSASGYALYDLNYSVAPTNDYTVTLDVKMTGGTFNFAGWLYMGQQRLSFPSSIDDGMEADKWYTFVFQSTNNDGGVQTASFYRKGPWITEDEKAQCEFEHITSSAGADHTGVPHINIGANNAPVGGAIYIDNVEVAEKDFVAGVSFKADGDEVEKADGLAGANEVVAEATIFSGSNLTPELNTTQTILPVLLAFDGDGRMLDCQMTVENIGMLYNTVTSTMNISSISEDIESLQFCIWDSIENIQPIFDSFELKN